MARTRSALAAACLLAAVLSSTAHAGPPGSTVLLTRPAGFGALTPPTVNDSISSSFTSNASFYGEAHAGRRLVGGPSNTTRYTVFVSRSDGLVADDDDSVDNVYVRDAVNETTTLVSRATDGTAANGSSNDPAISSDGRFVVFESRATNLVSNVDPNGTVQIYKRDLLNGVTTLVSRADGTAGAVANDNSTTPSVSTDGATVAFTSQATNLGDLSGHAQVYVRDNSSTLIASVKNGTTTPGGSDSFGPSVSDDGNFVAFTSAATDIGASDSNGNLDVFRFAVGSGAITVASMSTINPGQYGNNDSSGASISSDGHRVAFVSYATNLSALDNSATNADVYVHDFSGTPVTFLASQGGGAKANANSQDASISGDGVKIAFLTDATNLSGSDTNGFQDVYVRDTGMFGGTSLASRCQGGALLTLPAAEAAIAPNGTRVSFTTTSDGCTPQADDDFLQVFSRGLGLAPVGVELTSWISRPSGDGDFKSHTSDSAQHGFFRSEDAPSALSADGSVSVFTSESDELSPDDNNSVPNVFVREGRTGATELISRAGGADGAAGNAASGPHLHSGGGLSLNSTPPASISDDGRYVAFTSAADNLVPGDNNNRSDVFVRDRVAQTTTLVSVKTDGSQVNDSSFDADISADGRRVAFATDGRFDPAVDLGTDRSVYVRDLAAGTTTLASRQNGAGNADANSNAGAPSISGDGTKVAFVTDATNLAPSLVDGNGVSDVYVRDLAANTTFLASTRNSMLTAGDKGASAADIDATGTHVAFSSSSTNLVGASDVNALSDVYRRTMGTPDTVLVSHGPGGAAGNSSSGSPSISGDGNRVAFSSSATDLIAGGPTGTLSVFMADLPAGSLTLVSRGDGADGPFANSTSAYPSISADGHCVAFDSLADNLVTGFTGTDFTHGYLRAIDGDCGTPPPVPGPGPSPGPAPDTTAPSLTGLKVSPAKFRVSARRTAVSAKKAPKGTKIRFTLSEGAKVSLKIELKGKGRKKGRRCVARRRTGKRCTLYRAKGTLKRTGKAGANSVAFSGRIGSRKLAKGRYRVTATATDAAGNRSAKRTATFRVV